MAPSVKEVIMAPSVRWTLIILVLAVGFGRALDRMKSHDDREK
jgi:hypothetical protein